MLNSCMSKKCQQYLGYSSKIGLPVCLEFKDGCPVQFLNGTDNCPAYQSPYEAKEEPDGKVMLDKRRSHETTEP